MSRRDPTDRVARTDDACGLALGCPARAAEPDPWWGRDKALHFTVSIGLGSGGYAGSALWGPERRQRAAAGAGCSLTLGAGKELVDWAHLQPAQSRRW